MKDQSPCDFHAEIDMGTMDEELKEIPIGTWEVLKEGTDAIILTFGTTIPMALEAAATSEKENYSVKVVNARFIKPMDENLLQSLLTEKLPILTIEEAIVKVDLEAQFLNLHMIMVLWCNH